jgi:hypothetical protein
VTINNGITATIASFQSDQLNTTLIPGGVWAFYLHSYKENNNASFNIFVEVYKRTSGGTQTLLFTTDPAPVTTNSPNPSMQLSDSYFSGCPLVVTDSIVATVRATNTSNQSHVITLFSEGTQHYSYAVSSIPTQQGLTCDTLSGCSIIQTIETNITNLNNNKFDKTGGTISGDTIIQSGLSANTISATTYYNYPDTYVTGFSLTNDVIALSQNRTDSYSSFTVTLSGLTGTPQQIAYYNASGNLTGDTNFTRLDETNSYTTTINTVNFSNINEHQDTVYDFSRVRNRVFNDDTSLVGETNLNSNSHINTITNTTGGTVSGLEIVENGGSLRYQDGNGNYNGFNYTYYTVGWSVIVGNEHYFYNLPQSEHVVGGVLTDVNGNGALTWVVPTSSTFTGGTVSGPTNFTGGLTANTISATTYLNLPSFTGGTVSGATRFISGLTANTISATTYQNLPATPFLPLSGGTVNGQLSVSNASAETALIVSSSNAGTTYGIYSIATNGVNAYGVYGVASAGESESITNGIGGYFASDSSNNQDPINRYSVQLVDGTQGLNKVLTSVTSDGKSNWRGDINLSAVTATTITSNSVKVLPVALTVISNTASTNASLSSLFTLTLTGNTTLATPTNGFSGQRIVYRLRQDGTGNKLLTLSSGFRSGPVTVTLSTAANTTDYLGVIYNEFDNKWDVLALNKGYS